jgi:hypothetical protein
LRSSTVSASDLIILAALAIGAVLVHGYHPAVEDAEIYLPGILKLVQPSLFPRNAEFFQSHAGMSLFPNLVAASIRLAHAPVFDVLLVWHLACVFLLLLACWSVARLCFQRASAAWCGVALVASVLTIPVAGTALYLMDQYVTARSLSTPAAIFAAANALRARWFRTALWIALTALVHPLMAVFAAAYVVAVIACRGMPPRTVPIFGALLPALFPAVTPVYQEVMNTRPYFLLTNWEWYEWAGILAPVAVLAVFARAARGRNFGPLALACRALIVFEAVFFAAAMFISMPGRFGRFAEIQPMRCLQLVYCLMFVLAGGLIGEFCLKNRAWRWALLFVPLCGGMWFSARQLFPSTQHLELPWVASSNPWVQSFDWIRTHTPEDAYFALDPYHTTLPGEDVHGFRVLARRGMLADANKDSGAASMFPAIAGEWKQQMDAQRGWKSFQLADFRRLKREQGVDWVVVQRPGVAGLVCPYSNSVALVCRIE